MKNLETLEALANVFLLVLSAGYFVASLLAHRNGEGDYLYYILVAIFYLMARKI